MALVRPFGGVRYNPQFYSDLSTVIAPPFDTISGKLREELLARDPHNCIRLILGDPSTYDAQPDRYLKAGQEFKKWRDQGVVVEDEEPSIYLLEDRFIWKGKKVSRRGFLLTVKLEEFGHEHIFPHEKTFEGPIQDRLKLISATKAHLSPVYMVFEDDGFSIRRVIQELIRSTPLAECKNRDHPVSHRMWRISDPVVINRITQMMHPKPLLIADGHHRYTTALRYAKGEGKALREAQWILAFLAPAPDPGVVLSPIHRHVQTNVNPEEWMAHLSTLGTLEESTENGTTFEESSAPIGILVGAKPRMFLFHLNAKAYEHMDPDLKDVSTALLNEKIFPALGVDILQPHHPQGIRFFHDPEELKKATASGGLGFLLKDETVTKILSIVKKKKVMPQKSTFFYPKIMVGFAFHALS